MQVTSPEKISLYGEHSNIAFIKYWGNKDNDLRIPSNASVSMNLSELYTETTLSWDDTIETDYLTINGEPASQEAWQRTKSYLSRIREMYGINSFASITSKNNFPMGAGIASSASAFAALALAATKAADITLNESELSALARLGSGSAARSVPSGFTLWNSGTTHETSYAETIASEDHWNLVDIVAVVSTEHKRTGSTKGHELAITSDLQNGRLKNVSDRVDKCVHAIKERDFNLLAETVELASNLMHSVMMTSQPRLFYWEPTSLQIMKHVFEWRQDGLSVCYTMDAGPNVHCICLEEDVNEVKRRLSHIGGIQSLFESTPGPGVHIVNVN
jgi:diphosphomevalonate decarboxylase